MKLVLCVFLVLCLAGCGRKSPPNNGVAVEAESALAPVPFGEPFQLSDGATVTLNSVQVINSIGNARNHQVAPADSQFLAVEYVVQGSGGARELTVTPALSLIDTNGVVYEADPIAGAAYKSSESWFGNPIAKPLPNHARGTLIFTIPAGPLDRSAWYVLANGTQKLSLLKRL